MLFNFDEIVDCIFDIMLIDKGDYSVEDFEVLTNGFGDLG